MLDLTIIILTFNEEANIIGCLDSLKGINANLFIVDSYSTDKTIDIIKERDIRYVQHPFENYSKQRNWSQENNPFKTEWILNLDAGERLTPQMNDWINNSFDSEDSTYDGYMFSRKTMFFGQWIKYGGHYPNFHLRLYRKDKGRCEDKIYDQHFVVDGKTKTVPKGIDIIDTVCDNLKDFTIAHAKWAIYEAAERLLNDEDTGEVAPNLFGNKIERRRWLKNNLFQKTPIFVRSFFYFIYRYFIRLGFLDGKYGLVFHFLQGLWFRFLIDSVVYNISKTSKDSNQTIHEILQEKYGFDANVFLKDKTANG